MLLTLTLTGGEEVKTVENFPIKVLHGEAVRFEKCTAIAHLPKSFTSFLNLSPGAPHFKSRFYS